MASNHVPVHLPVLRLLEISTFRSFEVGIQVFEVVGRLDVLA